MIKQFKEEFHLMLKEQIGYFPWIKERSYRLYRLLYGERRCPCDRYGNERNLIRKIITVHLK